MDASLIDCIGWIWKLAEVDIIDIRLSLGQT